MKTLVIFPKNSLTPKDKERLSKQGYVAIEVEDPSKVIMLFPSSNPLRGDDLLMSALHGLSVGPLSESNRSAAWRELHRRLENKESKP